ncbi:hypothetical protein FOZ60_001865 [Perkinsus olseni]|uniref:glutathione-disulfide reductase n=1 Tax=Perkinsus olseni TaxID=32597 RepID=A0A7J6PJT5_PEROL|nr:hypothetical protein FOZ60_001865 [Perkinsus olseni]
MVVVLGLRHLCQKEVCQWQRQQQHHPPNTLDYDYLVIGGGSGGISSARRAASYRTPENPLKVGLVERDVDHMIGGTCVNVGCVPKKLSWSAATLNETFLHDASHYGFQTDEGSSAPPMDYTTFKHRRDKYLARLRGIYQNNLKKADVDLMRSAGRIVKSESDNDKVTVQLDDGKKVTASHVLIACGGQPEVPEIEGKECTIDSDGFFELEKLPKSVVVAGAGYIAVELAGIFNAFGVDTTLTVRRHKALRSFDEDISDELMVQMQKSGIKVATHFVPKKVTKDEATGALTFTAESGAEVRADCVLMAAGRTTKPNVEAIGCKGIIDLTPKGYIKVDKYQNTSMPRVYAVGDVIGNYELTPVAIAAGRTLSDRLFGPFQDKSNLYIDYETIPTVVFAHPPIGTCGLTEAQAVAKYGKDNLKIYRSRFVNLYYGIFQVEPSEKPKTLVKVICTGPEERVVGLHVLGMGADELLQGFAVAMRMGATKADLDRTVAIHPTAAEEIVTLAPWGPMSKH